MRVFYFYGLHIFFVKSINFVMLFLFLFFPKLGLVSHVYVIVLGQSVLPFCRMLLWHGSRLTNWVGILSQGLRIAPPEAPVTGYMVKLFQIVLVEESTRLCFAIGRFISRHFPAQLSEA